MARALYIHWPFCAKKCPYCDFNSHVRDTVDFDRWKQALISDMRHEAELAGGEALTSVFFGGGTPSLMPPSLVAALLEEAERLWGFSQGIEITLEANPSSVEASNFAGLASAGVNRVSLGVQSLRSDALRFLGRLHDVNEALQALETAQQIFDRVSFDLIYARPGQTEEQWRAELTQALSYGTSHLSLYQLTIEPGTRFQTEVRLGNITPLDDDPAAELFAVTQELTENAGLPAYETSNHARPGEESRHNLTYWRYEDYCGIGPGAHGRRRAQATERHKRPEAYLQAVETHGDGTKIHRDLPEMEQASEAILMGLRLVEGMQLQRLEKRFSIPRNQLLDLTKVELHQSLGLIWQDSGRLGVTPAGRPLLDGLLAELVSDDLVSA
ncbi:radical SAM family heme chaperone HemW [Altererythrobacter lutimaris]|uniref:Heme chaperone HemW n=1 Tax=Altererythrobacter lutimaris TaxID=2743979 RepID=A0A850HGS5_9SPHN|nr:coproporphyrinogen III oxidase [Altererythrobacter lutimaris]